MIAALTSREVLSLTARGAMRFSTTVEAAFVADVRRFQEYESTGTPSIPVGRSVDGDWIELSPAGRQRVNHFNNE